MERMPGIRSYWRLGFRRAWPAAVVAAALAIGPATSGAVECEGDECQVPPSPPEEVIPATSVVNGSANPPVDFEEERPSNKKKHGQKHHHRHGAKRAPKHR